MPSDQDRSALNDEERAKRYCAEIESSHGPDCPDCFEAMVGALSAEFAAVREESRAEVEKLTKERDEARAEAFRAMRIADAITLDTQSIEETVAALVDLTRKARAERDEFEAQLHDKETGVRRDRRLLQELRVEVERLKAAIDGQTAIALHGYDVRDEQIGELAREVEKLRAELAARVLLAESAERVIAEGASKVEKAETIIEAVRQLWPMISECSESAVESEWVRVLENALVDLDANAEQRHREEGE